ncbi:peptidylprolyl isomerase [Myxococcus sp. CA051A]|uniref:peptidylprolyl isomerase n=1 Tax=Myxococcus sp. CA051A TaxID=2741739 RepID=UPI00157AA794|nr:peptidylprolyl isomerase [Myxococcus sp. CA051A]
MQLSGLNGACAVAGVVCSRGGAVPGEALGQRPGARLIPVLLLVVALPLVACRDEGVVAEVGKRKVLKEDVTAFIAARSSRERPTSIEALDVLVGRSLLAEEARRAGLDQHPAVQSRLRAAERELLAQALLDQRLAEATSGAKLRERYDASREALGRREVHVRQILIRLSPGADDQTRAQAQSRMNALFARLMGGEPFEKVAREGSEEPISAARGGDLGPVLEGQVDDVFFTESARLTKGERSRPFATPYGLHLVEAVDGVKTVVPTFEEARGKLEAEARREAQAGVMKVLREQIPVKTYPERLETGASVGGGAGQQDPGSHP